MMRCRTIHTYQQWISIHFLHYYKMLIHIPVTFFSSFGIVWKKRRQQKRQVSRILWSEFALSDKRISRDRERQVLDDSVSICFWSGRLRASKKTPNDSFGHEGRWNTILCSSGMIKWPLWECWFSRQVKIGSTRTSFSLFRNLKHQQIKKGNQLGFLRNCQELILRKQKPSGKIGDVDCSNGEVWSWTTGLHGSGAEFPTLVALRGCFVYWTYVDTEIKQCIHLAWKHGTLSFSL